MLSSLLTTISPTALMPTAPNLPPIAEDTPEEEGRGFRVAQAVQAVLWGVRLGPQALSACPQALSACPQALSACPQALNACPQALLPLLHAV